MRRHDVPEQDVLLDAQPVERAPDDRCSRFRGACARHLSLGREREARDACAAVPRRLADEEHGGVRVRLQIIDEPRTEQPRPRAARVLVERAADPGRREVLDERLGSYDAGSVGELGATGLRGRTEAPPTRRT